MPLRFVQDDPQADEHRDQSNDHGLDEQHDQITGCDGRCGETGSQNGNDSIQDRAENIRIEGIPFQVQTFGTVRRGELLFLFH